jgi:nucleotide-binding universal stress UspA family protein
MTEIRKILSATDFSEASKQALDVAVAVAQKYGAEIYLLNVVAPIPHLPASSTYEFDVRKYEGLLHAEAEKLLASLAGAVSGPTVHTLVYEGDAAEGILRVAEQNEVDLIVIATAGRTGLGRALFGSVAEKVVRRAKCPVLTVRQP